MTGEKPIAERAWAWLRTAIIAAVVLFCIVSVIEGGKWRARQAEEARRRLVLLDEARERAVLYVYGGVNLDLLDSLPVSEFSAAKRREILDELPQRMRDRIAEFRRGDDAVPPPEAAPEPPP